MCGSLVEPVARLHIVACDGAAEKLRVAQRKAEGKLRARITFCCAAAQRFQGRVIVVFGEGGLGFIPGGRTCQAAEDAQADDDGGDQGESGEAGKLV